MFKLAENNTSFVKELQAAIVGFLTSVYILFLIPGLLSETGMPIPATTTAVALASGISCILMGLIANRPFVLAPGVGIGAYFAFGVALGRGLGWQGALAASLCASGLFFLLSLFGLREFMIRAIPQTIKLAFMSGVGLFLAIIGFRNTGIIVSDPVTLVALGDLTDPAVILALTGVLLLAILVLWRIPMAFFFALFVLTLIAWSTGLATWPTGVVSTPAGISEIAGQFDFSQFGSSNFIFAVLGFFFISLLDPTATFAGLGRLGGLVDDDGRIFGSSRSYIVDAGATLISSPLGSSPVTTFVESAVPLQEGGRTGLTAVLMGVMFLLAMFLLPVLGAIPALATGPLLIIVGALMMRGVADIEWVGMEDILPAFFAVATMALTFNIANGIALGMIAYVVLYWLAARTKEIHPFSYVLTALLAVYLVFFS
jgi:adenine/guanine/hypoxanthine permease